LGQSGRVGIVGDVIVDAAAQPEPTSAVMDDSRLQRSWVVWVTAGEFAGFSVPAAVAAVTVTKSVWLTMPLLVAAGFVEGGLLGLAQVHVLRRVLPGVHRMGWVAATAIGASVAWAIGLLPMLTDGRLFEAPNAVLLPLLVILGSALLGSIGTTQWLVLRSHIDRAQWWIAATAVAWVGGLIVFTVVTTPLWQPRQSAVLTIAIGVLGGLLMAATVGVLTGLAIVRLSRQHTRVTALIAARRE
jgi:hypothetical protein